MARQRSLKPTFFADEKVVSLSPKERLTFLGLLCYVDDEGRCVENVTSLRLFAWPGDAVTDEEMQSMLENLEEVGLIRRYEAGSKQLIQVTHFKEHQNVNLPQPSLWPPPEILTETRLKAKLGLPSDMLVPVPEVPLPNRTTNSPNSKQLSTSHKQIADRDSSNNGDTGVKGGGASSYTGDTYETRQSRQSIAFGALCWVTNQDPSELTGPARSYISKCAREITSVCKLPDLAAEILRRANNYRIRYPRVILTPAALVKHWSMCNEVEEEVGTAAWLLRRAEEA